MLFFRSNTFISNARVKLAKNKAKAKQQPEAELLLEYLLLSSNSNRRYSKNIQKISTFV